MTSPSPVAVALYTGDKRHLHHWTPAIKAADHGVELWRDTQHFRTPAEAIAEAERRLPTTDTPKEA